MTGMREQEVMYTYWSDVNLAHATVHVSRWQSVAASGRSSFTTMSTSSPTLRRRNRNRPGKAVRSAGEELHRRARHPILSSLGGNALGKISAAGSVTCAIGGSRASGK